MTEHQYRIYKPANVCLTKNCEGDTAEFQSFDRRTYVALHTCRKADDE